MARRAVIRWYAERVERVDAAAMAGLEQLAERIKGSSQAIAPLDTQDMIDSAAVTVGDGEAVVSYDTPYAVAQHERLDYNHAPGRQAKFLEAAAAEHAPGAAGVVGAAIRKVVD